MEIKTPPGIKIPSPRKDYPVREVTTLASNEDEVRFQIFGGELPPDKAYEELLRIEKAQRASDNYFWEVRYKTLFDEFFDYLEKNRKVKNLMFEVYITQGQGEAFVGSFDTKEAADAFVEEHKTEGSLVVKEVTANQSPENAG